MSGRIRSVKPELLEDAVTAGLDDTAFRLFIGCILIADDYGVFRAEEKFLHGQVFWKREPSGDLPESLAQLSEKLVQFWEVHGQRYGFIRGWFKHQKISHPGKRRLPEPPPESAPETLAKPSGEFPETLVPDLRPSTIDHRPGPSTIDAGEPRESPGRSKGAFGLEVGSWADGIRSVTKAKFIAPTGKPANDLMAALAEHCPPDRDRCDFARAKGAEYAALAAPGKLTAWGFIDWLNDPRPARASPRPNVAGLKQPADPKAPWMTLPEEKAS